MTKIRSTTEAHYEVREVAFGKDYVWVPGHALIECDCGQVIDASMHYKVCPVCGADHTPIIATLFERKPDYATLHPWHPDYEAWVSSRVSHAEDVEWLEQRAL